MQDIRDVATNLDKYARWNPKGGVDGKGDFRPDVEVVDGLKKHIFDQVRQLLVDQVMSICNAISPSTPDEKKCVDWLRGELTKIAQQIPETMEKKNAQ